MSCFITNKTLPVTDTQDGATFFFCAIQYVNMCGNTHMTAHLFLYSVPRFTSQLSFLCSVLRLSSQRSLPLSLSLSLSLCPISLSYISLSLLSLWVFPPMNANKNPVCFLLGNSPGSKFYMPTFRNTLFHLHRQVSVKND